MKLLATRTPRKIVIITTLLSTLIFSAATLATDSYQAAKSADKYPTYPTVDYGTGSKADLIKKGEYLVKMGDCIACHTKTDGKPFAGGRAIPTPFGTLYTPNITPDKQTGIGNWTQKDFVRALHDGINPKGKYYYPAFPYPYFNNITIPDLLAIHAYLRAIPAVSQKNHEDSMMFPFNWRFLQLGWRILFFKDKGPYKPDTNQSELWNRGKYLVSSLGHCSMCHTPSHYFIFKKWQLAAPIQKYYLTGGFVEGFYAPNITSTNLKNTPLQEIADVFKKDKLIGGGEVQGPMAEANHDSLKYLSKEDVLAIATYLKTVKSQTPPKKPTTGGALSAGKSVYDTYCTGCHTTGAGGAPKLGNVQDWAPRIKLGLNTLYKNAIHGIGGMPAKGTCSSCTIKQIQDAVQYIVSKSRAGAGKMDTTAPAGKPPKVYTLKDGETIYAKNCSVCHDGKYPGAPKIGDKQVWQSIMAKGMSNVLLKALKTHQDMPQNPKDKWNNAELIAATKYMVEQSKTKGNYSLW